MEIETLTRWFLAFFFSGVAGFYAVRVIALKRRLGVSPVSMGPPGTTHYATHLAFRAFRAAILLVCVARLVWPPVDVAIAPLHQLWSPAVLLTGDVLLGLAFIGAAAINVYLGRDWRSGTRRNDSHQLIQTGPYAVSRNPMMVFVLVGQLGFFLALPSVFSLACLVVGAWAVITQVAIEQALLRERFGAEYDAYAARTPMWLVFKGAGDLMPGPSSPSRDHKT